MEISSISGSFAPGAAQQGGGAGAEGAMAGLVRQFESILNAAPAFSSGAENLSGNSMVQELLHQEDRFKALNRDMIGLASELHDMSYAEMSERTLVAHQRMAGLQMEHTMTMSVVSSAKSALTTLIKNQ